MNNLAIIVARAHGGAIGRQGDLLCHLSADLRRFKALTMGYPIIMGRKTFESLPKGALPGRKNVVVTRNADFCAENVHVATSLEEALAATAGAERVFIIGGGEIYRQALPLADTLELTDIDMDAPDADTFFPQLDESEWTETFAEHHEQEGASPAFTFRTLERVSQYMRS